MYFFRPEPLILIKALFPILFQTANIGNFFDLLKGIFKNPSIIVKFAL